MLYDASVCDLNEMRGEKRRDLRFEEVSSLWAVQVSVRVESVVPDLEGSKANESEIELVVLGHEGRDEGEDLDGEGDERGGSPG